MCTALFFKYLRVELGDRCVCVDACMTELCMCMGTRRNWKHSVRKKTKHCEEVRVFWAPHSVQKAVLPVCLRGDDSCAVPRCECDVLRLSAVSAIQTPVAAETTLRCLGLSESCLLPVIVAMAIY